MGAIILQSIRFILFALFQVLILNNLEIGLGVYPMLYPLFILMLPFEMGTVALLLVSFVFGFAIDSFSNTYGLHASAALIFAYFRPQVFKLLAPRDGYENVEESNLYTMGPRWFISAYGLLLLIHHTWFFTLEIFSWNELLLLLRKIALSVPLSFLFGWITQLIFVPRRRSER